MFLPATISPRIIRWLLCGLLLPLAATASAINWNYLDGPFGGRVIALLLVAQNGDIYVTVSGLGVQRQAAGTTTWTAVDPAHITPHVAAVTIDSHGTIFAADAGRVVKLVNGSWVTAGDGQNGCADSLQVDASDTLWTACIPNLQLWSGATELKVQKLPSGASTWVSAGTVGGVSDGGVTTVTVDGAGTAYVGSSGLGYVGSDPFGIYSLAPGATTWTLNNAGLGSLDVLALQRDADGAVYAATGDGVYKRVAGIWQKVGTGLDTYVTALAIDTNGDLYAGTDTAWRLAAGTSTWTQIGLGLNGTITTLAVGGGRIYAGTGPIYGGSDAMGGSPSGVYILSMSDSLPPLAPLVDANQHGLTGSWYNPAASGQGIQLEIYPDMVAPGTGFLHGGWFTYKDIGYWDYDWEQRWYSFGGNVLAGQSSATLTIYQNVGGNFNAPPATSGTSVGTAVLSFQDCATATMQYVFTDGSYRSGVIPLVRLTPNVTCSTKGEILTSADFGYSGNWFDPVTSGQGFIFEVNPNAGTVFFAWATYAPQGQSQGAAGQRWYVGQGSYFPGTPTATATLYETCCGSFNEIAATLTSSVGAATVAFYSCHAASLTFSFTGGTNAGASGTINLSRVGPPPADCLP